MPFPFHFQLYPLPRQTYPYDSITLLLFGIIFRPKSGIYKILSHKNAIKSDFSKKWGGKVLYCKRVQITYLPFRGSEDTKDTLYSKGLGITSTFADKISEATYSDVKHQFTCFMLDGASDYQSKMQIRCWLSCATI